jgi:hypothetical protein
MHKGQKRRGLRKASCYGLMQGETLALISVGVIFPDNLREAKKGVKALDCLKISKKKAKAQSNF